jgi:L-threonylcarbamoyladenylate synthase
VETKHPIVVPADPASPRKDVIERAVAVLRDAGVVAVPTETLYGLAVDGLDPAALVRINRLKKKPDDSPILLLLAETDQVEAVSDRVPELFRPLAQRFWPGPLTLVVPARPDLPVQLSRDGTVAVRVPGLALPRRLARGLGRPISGVSANLNGEPPCRHAADVARIFAGSIEMILDGGVTSGGASSTILDISTPRPRVVREGILPLSALRPFLPHDG